MFFKLKKVVAAASGDFGEPITVPELRLARRSNSINHLSPTVCDDFSLPELCRIDTSGNIDHTTVELNDTVYIGWNGTNVFNGNNLYYAIEMSTAASGDNAYICQIGNDGVINDISTTCLIP